MPVTTLDPKTALVVIDLQKGIVAMPVVHPIDGVVSRAAALVDAFRERGLPIVLVNVTDVPKGRTEHPRRVAEFPAGFADFIPEMTPQPQDHIVTKRTPGAFTQTDLEAHLRNEGVTQIVLVGVSTSSGVEATGRNAFELGFNVTYAIDAMTDLDIDAHANSTTRIFPKFGETGTTQQILDLLAKGA
ncbi:isochorismatase family protein [Paraburkholderia flava]|uniref:isochorismatase family protein n=1 Tax=Paraburkholderia flava TaxID=2547393 RepID=UPI00105BC040|nr:isochorismatase family protein [Paraburkholderia flava]